MSIDGGPSYTKDSQPATGAEGFSKKAANEFARFLKTENFSPEGAMALSDESLGLVLHAIRAFVLINKVPVGPKIGISYIVGEEVAGRVKKGVGFVLVAAVAKKVIGPYEAMELWTDFSTWN